MLGTALTIFAWVGVPTGVTAQRRGQAVTPDSAPSALTIDDAVSLAVRNNPDYLRSANGRRSADAAVRAAKGGLLPQVNASLSGQYQQGGQQVLSGVALGPTSDILQSAYTIGVTYQLNRATFVTPKLERANRNAVDADIASSRENLRTTVRQQYLTVLQDAARVVLQDTLVASAASQLELARARADVGAGTGLDVQRAEVALGQQRVGRLRAQNDLNVDRVRLFQQMGLPPNTTAALTSQFPIDTGIPELSRLLQLAASDNPSVNALRARERAAHFGVTRARSEYIPTLTLSTGIGGYTYQYRNSGLLVDQASSSFDQQRAACVALQETRAAAGLPNSLAECTALTLTPAQASGIRANNDQFPFNFTRTPRTVSALFSLPIFDGFAREQRVQEASVQREDAEYARRSRELAVTADVTAAYLTLQTALSTVALQATNSAKAKQELGFVQDQYSVGLATFVDLTTSRASYEQAENDRITAEYDYHKALAALEGAVGRPLR